MEVMLVPRFALQFAGIDASSGGVALAWSIAQFIIGFLAVCASASRFVIPCITTIADIQREGSVGQRSSTPYALGLVNSVLWLIYGISPRGSWYIVVTNLIGLCSMVYCLVKFLQNCDHDQFQWALVCPISGGMFLICFGMYYVPNWRNNLTLLSWVCAASGALLALLPLRNLPTVRRSMNMQCMPSALLASISLVDAFLWGLFACTGPSMDGFIFGPSVVGFLSATAQLMLHVCLKENIDGVYEPLA